MYFLNSDEILLHYTDSHDLIYTFLFKGFGVLELGSDRVDSPVMITCIIAVCCMCCLHFLWRSISSATDNDEAIGAAVLS